MLPFILAGGVVLTVFAAPKAALGAVMIGEFVDGWKAKKKMKIYEAAKKLKIDPTKKGSLKEVTFEAEMFPDEVSWAAGRYLLTDLELFTLWKAMEAVIDDDHPEIGGKKVVVDLKAIVDEYKELTRLRTEDPDMQEFVS